jgi:hypothetical protein
VDVAAVVGGLDAEVEHVVQVFDEAEEEVVRRSFIPGARPQRGPTRSEFQGSSEIIQR